MFIDSIIAHLTLWVVGVKSFHAWGGWGV